MYRILHSKALNLKPEVATFAQALVRTPSPSHQEGAVAELIMKKMQQLGYDKVVCDSAGNIVGVMLGLQAGPTVLLNCHMDTAAAHGQWRGQPLGAEVADEKLHGLGASDCKGGLAAQVYAAALLKHCLLPLRGNIVVAATVAEETGCSLGVRALIESTLPELELKVDYAILGEPTGLGLYYGHDGWMDAEVIIEGADPFQVDDAAQAVFREFEPKATKLDCEEAAVRQPAFEDREGMRRARIGMTRRLHAQEDVQAVLGTLQHHAQLVTQALGSVAVQVRVRKEAQQLYTGRTTIVQHVTHAWTTDPFHPLVERARQSLTAATCSAQPGKFRLGRLGMGTAGGVLLNEYNIPTIAYGPGSEDQAHAQNEWADLRKISECVYGTAAIAHSLVGIPVYGWTSDEI